MMESGEEGFICLITEVEICSSEVRGPGATALFRVRELVGQLPRLTDRGALPKLVPRN